MANLPSYGRKTSRIGGAVKSKVILMRRNRNVVLWHIFAVPGSRK
jgi:hypothetical protein